MSAITDKPKRATRTRKADIPITTPPPAPPKRKRSTKTTPLKSASNEYDKSFETSPYFKTTQDNPVQLKLQPGQKLDKSFYNQDTVTLSKALLGKVLCRRLPGTGEVLKGTIVETEAYPGEGDAASHSFKGVPTEASMPMFMDPGTAYVYLTYGMYHCFNISAQDNGGACLLRAAEVHQNYEIMHTFRQSKKQREAQAAQASDEDNDKPVPSSKRLKIHELANGPSKLCMSFDITKAAFNKADMAVSDELWLEESMDPKYSLKQFEVKVSRRVGIDSTPPEARYKMYRFYVDGSLSVSKAKFKKDDKKNVGGKGKKSAATTAVVATRGRGKGRPKK